MTSVQLLSVLESLISLRVLHIHYKLFFFCFMVLSTSIPRKLNLFIQISDRILTRKKHGLVTSFMTPMSFSLRSILPSQWPATSTLSRVSFLNFALYSHLDPFPWIHVYIIDYYGSAYERGPVYIDTCMHNRLLRI